MIVWTSVFTAVGVNDCLIDMSYRSWKNPDRQTAAIWSTIVSWLSIRTPRFLTAVEWELHAGTVPFRNVNVCGRVLLFSWCRVPSQMICVLSPWYYGPCIMLHSLLPPPRSTAITSRLRSSQILPRVHTRTKRYCFFIQYGLNHYQ